MAASVKELNVPKQSASSERNMRPVLDWMIKKVPSIQKAQRTCDKENYCKFARKFWKGSSCLRTKRKTLVLKLNRRRRVRRRQPSWILRRVYQSPNVLRAVLSISLAVLDSRPCISPSSPLVTHWQLARRLATTC
jgi:hypothetical protein